MSDKSPLFVSALELLAHATELYVGGERRNYKFVILHLANAIELVLKDCLIDHDVSIYKNPKETITIWGAFSELETLSISVREKPVIELLIDDRNTIQHRFGFPNAEAVFYYLEETVSFFKRFLAEQYSVELAEALEGHLSEENRALIGLEKDNYRYLKKLLEISPEAAVQQAHAVVEAQLYEILFSLPEGAETAKWSIRASEDVVERFLAELASLGYLPTNILARYQSFLAVRNSVAHGRNLEGEEVPWREVLDTPITILSGIDSARSDGVIMAQDNFRPLTHLSRLSGEFVIHYARYAVLSELDRVRLMVGMRSRPEITSAKNTYVGILAYMVSKGYLPEEMVEKYEALRQSVAKQDEGGQDRGEDRPDLLLTAETIVLAIQRARQERAFSQK